MIDVFLFADLFPLPAASVDGGVRDDDDVHAALDRAMVMDAADRLAGNVQVRVKVWVRESGEDEGLEGCTIVVQQVRPAGRCVGEAVRAFYDRRESGKLVVILGRNPLFPPAEIERAALLMDGEDDAVVFAPSGAAGDGPAMLVGSRRYHPGLFCFPDPDVPGLDLHAVISSEAVIHPLRAIRTVSGRADFPWLMHEVEREVLLGHWYPRRTYEALKIMKRRHIIPEVQ